MASKDASAEDKFRYKQIQTHKTQSASLRASWEKAVNMYRSRSFGSDDTADSGYQTEDEGIVVENNHLYPFADTLVANITPPNPEVTITARRDVLEDSARLREKMINDFFYREKMHSKLWKLVTRAVVYPRSFVKCVWASKKGRPILRVLNPEHVFFDVTAEDWDDLRYICEVVVMTKGEFVNRIKKRGKKGGYYRTDALDQAVIGKYPNWLDTAETAPGQTVSIESDAQIVREGFEWVTVYEYYDFVAKKFYHFVEGSPLPLMESALPYKNLENPFAMLSFNDNLTDLGGLSDAELVMPTLERINELSALKMWHNKTSIPATVVHSGLVDDDSEFMDGLEQLNGPGQLLKLMAKQRVSIGDVLGQTPVPSLTPSWNEQEHQMEDLVNRILGLMDLQRGGVGNSDIATELALADTAIRTRNGRRQKAVYDIISWTGKAVVGLYMQFMPDDLKIPMRLGEDEDEAAVLTRDNLMLNRPFDPFDFDYEARPFNAQEANSVVQLKTIIEFMPVFTENPNTAPHIDQRKLIGKLLDLLDMTELMSDKPPQQPMQETMPGADPAAPDAAMPGVPAAAQPAMMGGEVEVGDGAQAAAAGLEGGPQPGGGTLK